MNTPVVITRETSETVVRVEARIGTGLAHIETPVRFLNHMLTVLARYSAIDLTVSASGDLRHKFLLTNHAKACNIN